MAITAKQRKFAQLIANGASGTDAARAAGYSDATPGTLRQAASRTLSIPEVQRAAFAEREKRLQGPLAKKALACLESIIDDTEAPVTERAKAARWVLEGAGHGLEARKLAVRAGDDSDKTPGQLTTVDLEILVMRAHERVELAKAAIIDAEVIDPN